MVMKLNLAILLVGTSLAAGAWAERLMQTEVKRIPIATVPLATAKTVDHVQVTRIEYEPGQATGRHVHPMPVVGYVLAGSFEVQVEGKDVHHYGTGEVIYEPPGTPIEKFDNGSRSQRATLLAYYLAGNGEDVVVKMLPPQ